MYCRFCGKEIPNEAVICLGCGSKVKNSPASATHDSSFSAIIFGILGIVLAWIFALAGHILSIIGIVAGIKEYKNNNIVSGLAVSIMGELCSIISSVIGVVTMMDYF